MVQHDQPTLPVELYRDIIQNVERSNLFNLVSVSKTLREEAEHALYDIIGLQHKAWRTPFNRSEWAALERLSTKESLLTYRLTSLHLWKYMWQNDCQYPRAHPPASLLAKVLQSTPNLVTLRIHAVTPALVSASLAVGLPFRLRIFHYSGITSRDKPFRTRLAAFLLDQRDLEELNIGGLTCVLPPDALAQLKILIGSPTSCLAFLPRPRLTHLKQEHYPRGGDSHDIPAVLLDGVRNISIPNLYGIPTAAGQAAPTVEFLEFVGFFPLRVGV